jgi:hypothetical protein
MTTASYSSAYDPSHFVGNTMGLKNLGDTSTMGGRRTRRHKKSSRKSKKSRKGGKKSRKSRR